MFGHPVADVLAATDLADGEPIGGDGCNEESFSDEILFLAAKAEDVIYHHYRSNLNLFLTHLFTVMSNARNEGDNQLGAVEHWFDKELESDTLQFRFNI